MGTRVFLVAGALLMASGCRQDQTSRTSEGEPTAASTDGESVLAASPSGDANVRAEAAPAAVAEKTPAIASPPAKPEPTPAGTSVVIPELRADGIEPQVRELLEARRAAVVEAPTSLGAWMGFGIACDAHKLFDCAEACYRQSLVLAPNTFTTMYYLAYVLDASRRDGNECIELYRAAAKIEPKYPPLYYRLGKALERRDRLPEALDAYLDALNVDYEFAPAHRAAGEVRIALGENDAAFKNLEYALRIAPRDSENLFALEKASGKVGRRMSFHSSKIPDPNRVKPDVPDPVREIVKETAVDSVVLFARAKEKIHAGEHAEAIADLKTVEAVTPDDPYVHTYLGTCYHRTGDLGLAAAHLKNAVRLKENAPGAQLEYAVLLIEIGRLEEGLHHYDLAVAQSIEPRDIHIWVGATLFGQGHMLYAVEAYESAFKIASLDAQSFSRWGTALFRQGDYEGAADKFKRATYVNPGYVDAFYNWGIALERAGKPDEAIPHYEKVLSLEPDHPRAGQRLDSLAVSKP